MKIKYLQMVDSTHIFLKNYIKTNDIKENICFYTNNQTNGIGSRDNKWEGEDGNLFFSFIIIDKYLPKDLKIQSASIYFAFILKEVLEQNGSKLFLKWPNDLYINHDKIVGVITNKSSKYLLCGIGINLKKNKLYNGYLDINITSIDLLELYFKALEKYPSWKQVFSKYRLEFLKRNNYYVNINNNKILLKDTSLNIDGSLSINGKKVFSLR